ncbi:SUKH-4 family immunity protein [Streptomyces griseoaurantiacus]|uniref:SUKH-4 family immunity protein n=1 Tax=Streptomyces griseoaurantiacus TaxID=68213 RepID=UPI002E299D3F|nr:SUKH-4 family immunity protein [Streptomyces jietaisiensis]
MNTICPRGTAEAAAERLPRTGARAQARRWPTGRPGRPGGLALDLPDRFLDDAFAPGAVVRFEDVDFPSVLSHEPTRRFLREIGLPEREYGFELDTEIPLPTLTEHAEYEELLAGQACEPRPLPRAADRLIRLGSVLPGTDLLLDGPTGEVLCWRAPDPTPHPLTADLSTLTVTLWLLHRERRTAALRG